MNAVLENPDRVWTYEGYSGLKDEVCFEIIDGKASAGILDRRGVMGAPDLAVEIISPTSLRRDRYDKRELYARFGVKEFWLADVANQSIEVLCLEEGGYRLVSCATTVGKVRSKVLPGFELEVASLA